MTDLPADSYLVNGRHAEGGPRFTPRLEVTKYEDGTVELRVECDKASDFWMNVLLKPEALRLLAEPPQ